MDCIVHGSQRDMTFTLSLAAEDEGRNMKKIAILLERWERGVDVGRQSSIPTIPSSLAHVISFE